jgi:peptide/nickel transport system substrate-binding protein
MRKLMLVGTAMAIAAVLAACGGSSSGGGSPATSPGGGSSAGAPVKEGGILRIGYLSGIDSINPFVAFNATAYIVFTEIYPELVQYDANFKIEGDWAKSWTTSPDKLTWTFALKPGGKWSDGTPLTADDAAWTCNLIIKYQKGAAASLYPFISHATKCSAPDPNTFVITYEKAVANVLPQLQQFFILPRHIWEPHVGVNGKSLKTWDPGSKLPIVGAGSFFVAKYDKKGTTILQRNPGYYGTKPHVDAVGISLYQTPDAMVAAYRAGQLDALDEVPVTVVDQLKADPKTVVQSGDGFQVRDFGFNSNPKKTKHRELLDPKVKDAFANAVDRATIVSTAFKGYAKPAYSLITPLSGPYLNTDLKPEPYDLAAANQKLDQLGYTKGSDGIRTVPGGGKMSYDVITPTGVENINREFDIIKASFAQIGVQLKQRALDDTTAFNEITAPDNKYLNYDMMLWDWVGYIDPDFVLSVVTCDQYGGWSDTGYCNPAYDKLYQQQGVTTDPDARRKIIWQMQDILYRDKPYIQIAQLDGIAAYSKQWSGLTPPSLQGLGKVAWDVIHRA